MRLQQLPSRLGKLPGNEDGAVLVEAAFALPLTMALLLGIAGWGLLIWEINTVNYATQQGARCAVLPTPVSGASKNCGSYDVFSKNSAYGFSAISNRNFSKKTVVFSFVNEAGKVGDATVQCVAFNTSFMSGTVANSDSTNWLSSMNIVLPFLGSSIATQLSQSWSTAFCRPS